MKRDPLSMGIALIQISVILILGAVALLAVGCLCHPLVFGGLLVSTCKLFIELGVASFAAADLSLLLGLGLSVAEK